MLVRSHLNKRRYPPYFDYYYEVDYLLMLFKKDFDNQCAKVVLLKNVQMAFDSIWIKDRFAPIKLELTLFNQKNIYTTSTFCFKENAADIVMMCFYQWYNSIKEQDSDDALNEQFITTFEDFLIRYMLTGALRIRFLIGSKLDTIPNKSKQEEYAFNNIKNYVFLIRNNVKVK